MKEVFFYFLKLGFTGFGGPLAVVAILQKELVEEKKWMDPEEFLKVLPFIKSMPGAFAFQTSVYLGVKRAGRWGGIAAGLGLVLPAFFMMIGLAKFLEIYGDLEFIRPWIEGFQWAAIALMVGAIKGLTQGYHRSGLFWILTIVAALSQLSSSVSEVLVILSLGTLSWVYLSRFKHPGVFSLAAIPLAAAQIVVPTLTHLFWICFSSGAFVFGTGLAITPLLENEFVLKTGWISHDDFMTAMALGQMTPGPVLITVTMIGFKVFGMLGAALATFAVFLPSWVHMLTWFPHFSAKLTKLRSVQHFLLGALAAVVGAIIMTIINLIRVGNRPFLGLVIMGALLFAAQKLKLSSWKMILLGGILYYVGLKILNIF